MNCAECEPQLSAWLDGALTDSEARAVEQHLAECPACEARVDRASRLGTLPREIQPPAALRGETLRTVGLHRARARRRRWIGGAMIVAAAAAVVLVTVPAKKALPEADIVDTGELAATRAEPQLAALDAAERDVRGALRDHPDDAELVASLTRIRRQREALQRLVNETKS